MLNLSNVTKTLYFLSSLLWNPPKPSAIVTRIKAVKVRGGRLRDVCGIVFRRRFCGRPRLRRQFYRNFTLYKNTICHCLMSLHPFTPPAWFGIIFLILVPIRGDSPREKISYLTTKENEPRPTWRTEVQKALNTELPHDEARLENTCNNATLRLRWCFQKLSNSGYF